MKNILIYLLLLFFATTALAMETDSPDVVRLKCKGDTVKKTRNNEVVGDMYVFTIKDGQIYDDEGKLIKNATITDDNIKGVARYWNGLTYESVRFSINRYSGAFNYHKVNKSLSENSKIQNNGICEVIKNKKMF